MLDSRVEGTGICKDEWLGNKVQGREKAGKVYKEFRITKNDWKNCQEQRETEIKHEHLESPQHLASVLRRWWLRGEWIVSVGRGSWELLSLLAGQVAQRMGSPGDVERDKSWPGRRGKVKDVVRIRERRRISKEEVKQMCWEYQAVPHGSIVCRLCGLNSTSFLVALMYPIYNTGLI